MPFDPQYQNVSPTTLPSPLHLAAAEVPAPERQAASAVQRRRARRLLAWQAAAALSFDAAILAGMLALAWKLLMPWTRSLDAAEALIVIGLVVCGGLWTAFVEQDLRRWRRVRRILRR